MPDIRYGTPNAIDPYINALPNTLAFVSSKKSIPTVSHVYIPAINAISKMQLKVYPRYVISIYVLDLYISILLPTSARIDNVTKRSVLVKVSELPSPNQAVSEKGIYIFRKTMAKSTEKVTVPINWYFPSKYLGNFLFMLWQK